MSILEVQLEDIVRQYAGAKVEARPDGTTLITIPDVPLPPGWNRSQATVQFITPVGFPMAQPDCFWTDAELRLAGGGLPKNSNLQNPPPFGGGAKLWFSWHVAVWNGSRDSLRSYLAVIMNRLAHPE